MDPVTLELRRSLRGVVSQVQKRLIQSTRTVRSLKEVMDRLQHPQRRVQESVADLSYQLRQVGERLQLILRKSGEASVVSSPDALSLCDILFRKTQFLYQIARNQWKLLVGSDQDPLFAPHPLVAEPQEVDHHD